MTTKLSERIAVVGVIDPQVVDDADATTNWVDMSKHHKVAFVLNIGATDIEVDAKLVEALTDSGGTPQDISGLAITQLDATTGENAQTVLEVASNELDQADSYRYVALKVTVGDGTSGAYISAIALGGDLRYGPATDVDLASVAEIV